MSIQAVASVLQQHNIPFVRVAAKYTRQNDFLRHALSERDLASDKYVIHEYGPAMLYFEYLRDNDEDEYQRLVDASGNDDPDDGELFDAIISGKYTPADGIVESFLSDTPEHQLEDALRDDNEGASALNFSLNNNGKLLPRQTWVGHFCEDAHAIATKGFLYGASDPYDLGLTTHKSESYRKHIPGYNFGFALRDIHKNFNDRDNRKSGKYGAELVLFQTSGVSAYHSGDKEDQVIFWGPDVEWVVPIYPAPVDDYNKHSDEDYAVYAKDGSVVFRTYCEVQKSKTAGNYARHNIEVCAAWVVKNISAYRRSIIWELPKSKSA